MRHAVVVTGLAFGDEGKGTVVDLVTAVADSSSAVTVVRHNGGAQAAHNVVRHRPGQESVHHTFSQVGAGTFHRARTHLSRFMLLNPLNFMLEWNALVKAKIVPAGARSMENMVTIDPRCRIITPLHRAANRLRELARGDDRHGSTGQGIGETVQLALNHPADVLYGGDLRNRRLVMDKLERMQKLLVDDLRDAPTASPEWELLNAPKDSLAFFADQLVGFGNTATFREDALVLSEATDVVFEGAQGILLDEVHGFAPHTTWSNTTSTNAHTLMDEIGFAGPRLTIGVCRTYMTRHGAGPLPTESKVLRVPEVHNEFGYWQGGWRQGWLDIDLLRYALRCDTHIDAVAVTHVDSYVHMMDKWSVKCDDQVRRIARPNVPGGPLMTPGGDAFAARIAEWLDRDLVLTSYGPTMATKNVIRDPWPRPDSLDAAVAR